MLTGWWVQVFYLIKKGGKGALTYPKILALYNCIIQILFIYFPPDNIRKRDRGDEYPTITSKKRRASHNSLGRAYSDIIPNYTVAIWPSIVLQ